MLITALTAATCQAVILHVGTLAHAAFAHGEDRRIGAKRFDADDVIAFVEVDAANALGEAAAERRFPP